MATADANRTQLRYIAETTWGTTPATADMEELRLTGESLNYGIEYIQSNELRSDRMVSDLVQTGAECGGGIDFELSYATFNDFIEAAMFSTWGSDISVATAGLAFNNGTSKITSDEATAFTGIVAGQWIKVANSSNASNDGYYLITTKTSNQDITVSPAPAVSVTTADEAATVNACMIRNGTTEKSFSIERYHADLTPALYFQFTGMMVNQMAFNVQANSILTGNLTFIGKDTSVATGSMSSGSVNTATNNDVMNAVSNVAQIREGGSAMTGVYIQGLDFTLNNNIRGLKAINVLGNADLGAGSLEVTGSMNLYLSNKDLYDKFANNTESSFSFRVSDGNGAIDKNTYVFTFHRFKFESNNINATGINTDVMQNFTWRALRHATYNCMIQIDKFAAE